MSVLTMLSGDKPGQVFPIDHDELVISSRPGERRITLLGPHVSKLHARILRWADGDYIENFENKNPTWINGQKLEGRWRLRDGDVIKICQFTLSYSQSSGPFSRTARLLEVVDLSDASSANWSRTRGREKLRAIMEIAAELVGVVDVETILDNALGALFRVFPQADRGLVLTRDLEEGILTVKSSKQRGPDVRPVRPSYTVWELVAGAGHALLFEDVAADKRLISSDNSDFSKIESIMCSPLWDHDRSPIGVVQIDTGRRPDRFTQDDLDFLVAVSGTISMALENARLLDIERRIDQEIRDAWIVQNSFIPEHPPVVPGYEFGQHYAPARTVGGDYFDYLAVGGPDAPPSGLSNWAIGVGDVAGKGLPAALLMARIATEARLLFRVVPDPTRLVGLLNQGLCEHEVGGRFITFLLMLLDPAQHELTIINAGHWCPLVKRAAGSIETIGEIGEHYPLGIVPDHPFGTISTQLGPGDVVLAYTDGVTDAESPSEERFGEERLRGCLESAPGGATAVAKAVWDAVQAHRHGHKQLDDITILCLSRSAC